MTSLFALLRILFYLSLKLVHGLYAMQFIMLLYYTVNRGDFERRGDFEHFTKTNFVFFTKTNFVKYFSRPRAVSYLVSV